jgi:hypothetical protein
MTAYRRDLGGHQTHDPTTTTRFAAVQKKKIGQRSKSAEAMKYHEILLLLQKNDVFVILF